MEVPSQKTVTIPESKNMHGKYSFNAQNTVAHGQCEPEEHNGEGAGRERDRREERGGMERIILSTEKQVESWISPEHLQRDTVHVYSILKCKHGPASPLSYWFNRVNRKNVVYHRHWCDLQRPNTAWNTHTESRNVSFTVRLIRPQTIFNGIVSKRPTR